MDSKNDALTIFSAGVESVKPDQLIAQFISFQNSILKIKDLSFELKENSRIFVVGAGKASALMEKEIESILNQRIAGGHIITKYGHSIPLKSIGITEAGHPVPDENGIKGSREILALAKEAKEGDLFICLISGGGSSLLADVPEDCTLEELKILNDALLKCGATINEINCIRKHLSSVKGGFLSKAVWPGKIVSLILSDVIGDPLDVIASGPTCADPTTFTDALTILKNYKIIDKIPASIIKVLRDGQQGNREETPKENNEFLKRTKNVIIGNNVLALQSARQKAEELGYETQIITSTLDGDSEEVARFITEMAKSTKELELHKHICLLFGGEPTVKLKGTGLGGRNQHLTLLVAKLLNGMPGITFLSAGTDGSDGPTDAAGAVIDAQTLLRASRLNLDVEDYLSHFDSYHFFKKEGGLILTGPTQTNVMDMMVLLIQ